MVRVGYPEQWLPEKSDAFPAGATLVPLAAEISEPMEIEFYVPAFPRARAERQMARLRGVKVVQSVMAGVEWLLPWIPRNLVLCDGRGIHDTSTSEWAAGAVLAGLKYFPWYRDFQNTGHWAVRPEIAAAVRVEQQASPGRVLCEELAGKVVLIVGYGSIGAAIERRLAPFEVEFLRVARHGREGVYGVEQLDGLLPQADVVVLVLPLTPETTHLMNAERFARMKPGALFINAARGPVADTDALVGALEQRRIRAVVDVTDPEPLPAGHPLWTAPNCFITPHSAGATAGFFARAVRFTAQQVERYMLGQPLLNVVDHDQGY